ncbi:MAG: hypothetical protein J6Y78_16515 [Paludibacteraceae bacterium]|nr:hypothetical protein [Paludibacteraceae bacterium]
MKKIIKSRYFKCDCCGKTFPYRAMRITEECVGEYWGMPYYETECTSPCCRCSFEEIEPREIEIDTEEDWI